MQGNLDSVLAANIALQAESQRKIFDERQAELKRQMHRQRVEAMRNVAWSIYSHAELGPMYAMLNPDPRAYDIARTSADRIQAAAIKFMGEYK